MNQKMSMMGWIVAAALCGVMLGGGFQTADVKIGVVDFASVVEKSEYYTTNEKSLSAQKDARESLLQFLFQYKVATPEQSQRLRELTVKENLSPAEKTEKDKLMSDLKDADKDKQAIIQKTNPTPDETTRLKSYQDRSRAMDETLARWQQDFQDELGKKFQEVRNTAVERARQAVGNVGKQGAYSVLFRADIAPYGANDVTDAALKAMNAIK